MDAAERALLEETVAGAIVESADADRALAELGWLDMLDAEADDAIAIVFAALGATNNSATALDDVLVAALGYRPRAELAVLLPRFATWDPPGAHGLATARVAVAEEIVVAADTGVAIIPTSGVSVAPMPGVDPDAGWQLVDVDLEGVSFSSTPDDAWDTAVAHGRRAISYEIAGATRAMLDLARQHAIDRVQFGRPVARFQAVRHRLADALVAVEALDAVLGAAADAPGAETAALAKAVAGRTVRTVAAHCQQVLAGIGFTTDHPFHRYLKRTMLLDGLFGGADDLAVVIGRNLLASRTVPTLIEL
jgi:hypothetical protein